LDKNRAFVPGRHQNSALGQMYVKSKGLQDLLSEVRVLLITKIALISSVIYQGPDDTLFIRFARKVAEGSFDNQPVFMGLVSLMTERVERDNQGKGTQNMQYSPEFDEWAHELLCISPEAYRSFQSMFGGRSERSFLKLRSSKPAFTEGITPEVKERAKQYLLDYGYPSEGPLAMGVDDTKLLAALQPYYDGQKQKWIMVGSTEGPMEVVDIDLLQSEIQQAHASKATKLRLWTLSIPLPNIPPLILAAKPIGSKNNAKELAKMEQHLLELLIPSDVNLNVISLGSDGTTVEQEARRELLRSGFAKPVHYRLPHPSGNGESIVIELMQIGERVQVVIQDTKHGRKTTRNNAQNGTRTLVFANYTVFYEQIREMAFSGPDSPLYKRDVEKLDRQDDRAAARLFSSRTLEFLVEHGSDNLGLIAYLFVFGELVDSYQSRKISHAERVKMAFRAKFFKDIWKGFLNEAGYSTARHFISREADDIIDITVNGYLGLVYIHRDVLKSLFPLLPWMHGTEPDEHVFGNFRDLIPDFTMMDVLRLVPKCHVRLMAACKRQGTKTDFKKRASGYSHTYSDATDANLHFLAIFPTDAEMASAAKTAYDEAVMLWEILGYYASSSAATAAPPLKDLTLDYDDNGDDDGDDCGEVSDRQELQNALDAAAVTQAKSIPLNQTEEVLDECGYASACLNFADVQTM